MPCNPSHAAIVHSEPSNRAIFACAITPHTPHAQLRAHWDARNYTHPPRLHAIARDCAIVQGVCPVNDSSQAEERIAAAREFVEKHFASYSADARATLILAYVTAMTGTGLVKKTKAALPEIPPMDSVDQAARFVQATCVIDKDGQAGSRMLHERYKRWAMNEGIERPISNKMFRQRLTEMGFGETRKPAGKFVTGLRCKDRLEIARV